MPRLVHFLILLALLGFGVFVRVGDFGWIQGLRHFSFDGLNRLHVRAATDQVVIVDIDESSLARPELGQWPWPRDIVAQLVDSLHAMGAQAIVFDMVFAEEDRTSPRRILARYGAVAGDLIAQTDWPDHDEIMADSLRRAGNVVTGFIWSAQTGLIRPEPYEVRPVLLRRQVEGLYDTITPVPDFVTNLPIFAQAAAGNGSFGVRPEHDGIIRRVPLLFQYRASGQDRGRFYPALAIEALRVAQDPASHIRIRSVSEEESRLLAPPLRLDVGAHSVPMDYDGSFYIRFSRERRERYIPAWQILSGQADPARIAGRIVFIGTSAEGLRDIRATPLDLSVAGVELHANMAEQILQGDFRFRPGIMDGAELFYFVLAGGIIVVLAPFVGAVTLGLVTLGLSGAAVYGAWHAYVHMGLLVDAVFPVLFLFALFVSGAFLAYIRTEKDRRRVRTAFGHYVSSDLMREIARDPSKLSLGGEVRDISVMFSDIRNFTSISERLDPEGLTALMNDFLTPMSVAIMAQRGTIDKYMGDAIMAFWNAPLDDPDHAVHACKVALGLGAVLAPVNAALARRAAEKNEAPIVLRAGIGVNTGLACVGNMGSRQRFAYSAMGDTVNLASRLEGQTKTYGVDNLIGGATAEQVSGQFAMLELDLLRVKGKQEPVQIFTLLGDAQMCRTEDFLSWKAAHDAMISACRSRDFEAAQKALDSARGFAQKRLESYYTLYAARIAYWNHTPPPPDWDGVFVAEGK